MKKIFLLSSIIIFSSIISRADKKPLISNQDEVIKAATRALDAAMKSPEGSLYLWAMDKGIQGKYILDISIHEKGEVATVFCAERDGGSIDHQNKLKDLVKAFEFDFKMPKGKRYKFTYTFDFSY